MVLPKADQTITGIPGFSPILTSQAISSTSATVSPHPQAQSSGTSPGAVAGIAIGCFIAGAFLSFAVAFCLAPAVLAESKPCPVPATQDKFHLNQFLLDSAPEKELAAELHSLGSLIQQHVENNYHIRPVQADPQTLAASLVQLRISNTGSLTPEAVAALALEPSTRHVAIQHVISHVVFSSIDIGSRSQLSMLPAPVASFMRSIPPEEKGESNAEVLSHALNKWRVLSAFLLHPAHSQRTPLPARSAAVAQQAAVLAAGLDDFLGYFAAEADETGRFHQNSHLQAVVAECAKLGYVLLSQPCEWRFVHAPARRGAGGGGGHTATVCAGLLKATHKDGTPYGMPQEVVPPMVVQLWV